MGLFDDMRSKAEDLAGEHGDAIAQGLDKVAEVIDEKTGGQHADKIDTGVAKAKELVEKLGEADRQP